MVYYAAHSAAKLLIRVHPQSSRILAQPKWLLPTNRVHQLHLETTKVVRIPTLGVVGAEAIQEVEEVEGVEVSEGAETGKKSSDVQNGGA